MSDTLQHDKLLMYAFVICYLIQKLLQTPLAVVAVVVSPLPADVSHVRFHHRLIPWFHTYLCPNFWVTNNSQSSYMHRSA